jgi:hypothetical protein
MPLNREERKLLHQKSKQPTFGSGKPDKGSGNEGDVAFRKIHDSGTVQYLKQDGDWVAISSSGTLPPKRSGTSTSPTSTFTSTHSSLIGLGSDDHEQYLLIDGSRAMSGNLNMGTNDIGSVGALDVDGHTTLDQVTINTTDGAFSVSGANPITLSTSSSNDIDINTSGTLDVDATSNYELTVGGSCNWGVTGTTDWRNTGRFILTGTDNITVETNGASTEKTILLFNDNDPVASFRGIHLKTDSKGTASVENSIFIECDGRGAKGGGDGVDIRSEDGILIRAENPNSGLANNIQIRATEHIDLAGNSSSITPTGDTIKRTKIHGVAEIVQLYRPTDEKIITNLDTITSPFGGTPETGHTEFEAINTYHLLRAQTYKASFSSIIAGATETIVSSADDDNGLGTAWSITIVWHHGTSNPCMQSYICFGVSSTSLTTTLVAEELSTNAGGSLVWTSSNGIVFRNDHSSGGTITTLKASALRLQSKDDF